MEVEPPSAMTRFGMFFLIGGVVLIFTFWGILKYMDRDRPATPAASRNAPAVTPASPSPTPTPAKPSPSAMAS